MAGGFGSRIRPDSAGRIGLFPDSLIHRIVPLGNAALLGAALQLSDPAKEELVQKFVTLGQYISLSGDPVFTENYVESMFFKTAE